MIFGIGARIELGEAQSSSSALVERLRTAGHPQVAANIVCGLFYALRKYFFLYSGKKIVQEF